MTTAPPSTSMERHETDPAPERPAAEPAEPAAIAPAMGKTVGRGVSWMIFNTAGFKASSLAAQIVLGWYLLKDEFGVFALATGVSALLTAFGENGVREYLTQRGGRDQSLFGPVFWLALALQTAVGLVMVAIAPLAAAAYGDQRVMYLLFVIAAAFPLRAPAAIFWARMRIDMRFRGMAVTMMCAGILRNLSMIGFVLAGYGPMAFVLPLFISGAFEIVAGYALTRMPLWRLKPDMSRWRAIMRHAAWLMLGALAMNLINMGDYFVIGFVVGKAVVGAYFFAFQLVAQMTVMLSDNLQQVLFPTLTRLQEEPDRLRSATLRTLRAFSFLAAPASLGFAVTIPFIEQVIWQGKFAHDAVPAVQILCLFFAFRLTNGFTMSVLKARGAFQGWFWTTLIEGVGVVAAATLGAWLGGQPWTIALAVGVWAVISRLAITLYTVRPNGITPMEVADALLRPLLLAVAAGCIGMLPTWAFAPQFQSWLAPITTLAPAPAPGATGWAFTSTTLHALLMGMIQAAIFSIVFLAIARLLAARQLADCLDALPARIATPARRLLRLA